MTEIQKGLEDCLRFRVAAIEEVENPHGYKLVPEAIVEIAADIVQFLRSKDVVRKVEGELPVLTLPMHVGVDTLVGIAGKEFYNKSQQDMLKAGYTLTTEEL